MCVGLKQFFAHWIMIGIYAWATSNGVCYMPSKMQNDQAIKCSYYCGFEMLFFMEAMKLESIVLV